MPLRWKFNMSKLSNMMQKIGLFAILILVMSLFSGFVFGFEGKGILSLETDPEIPLYVPGELLVKLKPQTAEIARKTLPNSIGTNSLDALNSKFGVKKIERVIKGKSRTDFFPTIASRSKVTDAVKYRAELEQWVKLTASDATDLEAMIVAYSQDPNVEFAQPNHIPVLYSVPNDPLYPIQWPLHNTGQEYPGSIYSQETGEYQRVTNTGTPDSDIDAEEAWDISQGEGVIVAVIDTGVDYNHPDLADNIWINPCEDINGNGIVDPEDFNDVDDACPNEQPNGFIDDIRGYDFAESADLNGDGDYTDPLDAKDPDPMDIHGHGTHVAGTIAAVANDIGISGVVPLGKIMPVKIFGKKVSSMSVSNAIAYAVDNGASVLSNSWGYRFGIEDKLTADAILYAVSKDAVVVFAAGNDDTDIKHFPGAQLEVVGVAATDSNDKRAGFSNYGSWVDISAPGVDILSLRGKDFIMHQGDGSAQIVDDKYYIASGTSMAAPHVAGVMALVRSLHPDWNNAQVIGQVIGYADPIDHLNEVYSGLLGFGRVNAYNALTFPSEAHLLSIDEVKIDDSLGNNDGIINPGETILLDIKVRNLRSSVDNVHGKIINSPSIAIVKDEEILYGNFEAGELKSAQKAFTVTISSDAPDYTFINLELQFRSGLKQLNTRPFSIKVGTDPEEPQTITFQQIVGEMDSDLRDKLYNEIRKINNLLYDFESDQLFDETEPSAKFKANIKVAEGGDVDRKTKVKIDEALSLWKSFFEGKYGKLHVEITESKLLPSGPCDYEDGLGYMWCYQIEADIEGTGFEVEEQLDYDLKVKVDIVDKVKMENGVEVFFEVLVENTGEGESRKYSLNKFFDVDRFNGNFIIPPPMFDLEGALGPGESRLFQFSNFYKKGIYGARFEVNDFNLFCSQTPCSGPKDTILENDVDTIDVVAFLSDETKDQDLTIVEVNKEFTPIGDDTKVTFEVAIVNVGGKESKGYYFKFDNGDGESTEFEYLTYVINPEGIKYERMTHIYKPGTFNPTFEVNTEGDSDTSNNINDEIEIDTMVPDLAITSAEIIKYDVVNSDLGLVDVTFKVVVENLGTASSDKYSIVKKFRENGPTFGPFNWEEESIEAKGKKEFMFIEKYQAIKDYTATFSLSVQNNCGFGATTNLCDIRDRDKTNNKDTVDVNLNGIPKLPDLTITDVKIVKQWGRKYLKVTIKNQGNEETQKIFAVRIDINNRKYSERNVYTVLRPDQERTLTYYISSSSRYILPRSGSIYTAKVDSTNVIDELDETNNVRSIRDYYNSLDNSKSYSRPLTVRR